MDISRILIEVGKEVTKDVTAKSKGEEAIKKRKQIKKQQTESALGIFFIPIIFLILIFVLTN